MKINEKIAGWIAFYNKNRLDIEYGKDATDLYKAKQFAIKHFKVPKSKQGMLAIAPATNEDFENSDYVISEENDDNNSNTNNISNIIKYAQEGNPSKLKSEIGAVLGSKIMDHIDTRRQEIAQDMFGEGVQYSGFSSYETKMIKLADKIVNVTKEGDSINKMAKGISKQINNGEGISPKQAEWIANTWKSFKK
jgi:hypothetical protein